MLAMRSMPIDDTNSMAFEDPALALGKVAVVETRRRQ